MLTILEARVGVEPTNGGFADLSLRPLGYRAETMKYSETGVCLSVVARSPADLAGSHGHDLRFADEARGFLGRRGADIKSRAPLEARHFGELGNDLDMPVIMLVRFLANRRSVNHQVVSRPVENHIEARKVVLEHLGKPRIDQALMILERRSVLLRQNPHLKRKARRVRGKRHKQFRFANHAHARLLLLPDHVAENAALLIDVIVAR